MEAVIQSFISGFPILMLHSSLTIALLAVGVLIYIKVTPYDDIGLIRDGNIAAAVSLAGAVLGLGLPLAFTMASSITTPIISETPLCMYIRTYLCTTYLRTYAHI